MNGEHTNPVESLSEEDVAQVAFDTKDAPYRGFHVRASYLKPPNDRDARIEVFRDGVLWRTLSTPAYRIYNVAAHFSEMVDSTLEQEENPSAHVAAGVTGHD